MIKLKDLLEITDIPENPFPPSKYSDDWKDDDDMNMNDEEFEEFQNELNSWLENIRINNLTNELVDTTDLIIDFLLMDEKDRDDISNMSDKERTKRTISCEARGSKPLVGSSKNKISGSFIRIFAKATLILQPPEKDFMLILSW